jgi:O-antigen/teichoic acid export membrane protein
VVIVVQRLAALAVVTTAWLMDADELVFALMLAVQGVLVVLSVCLLIPVIRRPVHPLSMVPSTFGYWMASLAGNIRNLEATVVGAAGALHSAGTFGVATRVMNPLLIPAAAIQTVEMPRLAGVRDPETLRRVRRQVMLTATICAGLILIASPLVSIGLMWAVGPGYDGLFLVSLGYSIAAAIATIVSGFGTLALAEGAPGVVAWAVGISNAIDLIALYLISSTAFVGWLWLVPPLAHVLQLFLVWFGWRKVNHKRLSDRLSRERLAA